ncbi:MAG: hypothetical protein ACYC0V_18470 [Armatimonadota bacterium]
MSVQELLHWWNLIFLLPLLMSVLWMLSAMFGGLHGGHDIGHGAHDIGHGLGHMADDAGHALHSLMHPDAGGHGGDAGAGHAHANGGSHADSGHGHDAHPHNGSANHENDFFSRASWFLGINDVPVTMLIGIFSLCWGVLGLLSNQMLAVGVKYPAVYIFPSIGIAFFGGFIITRIMAAVVAKVAPSNENYAVHIFDLVGLPGKTVHITDNKVGTVDVKDKYGSVHRVQAKTENENESIPHSIDVVVVDYDDTDKRYIVRKGII